MNINQIITIFAGVVSCYEYNGAATSLRILQDFNILSDEIDLEELELLNEAGIIDSSKFYTLLIENLNQLTLQKNELTVNIKQLV